MITSKVKRIIHAFPFVPGSVCMSCIATEEDHCRVVETFASN